MQAFDAFLLFCAVVWFLVWALARPSSPNQKALNRILWVLIAGAFFLGGFFFFLDLLTPVFTASWSEGMIGRLCLFVGVGVLWWLGHKSSPEKRVLFFAFAFPVYGCCVAIQKVGQWCLPALMSMIATAWRNVGDGIENAGRSLVDAGNAFAETLAHIGPFLVILLVGVASLAVYFFPAYVAVRREKRNALAIFILNLFLGWTLLFWVAALVWACTHDE